MLWRRNSSVTATAAARPSPCQVHGVLVYLCLLSDTPQTHCPGVVLSPRAPSIRRLAARRRAGGLVFAVTPSKMATVP